MVKIINILSVIALASVQAQEQNGFDLSKVNADSLNNIDFNAAKEGLQNLANQANTPEGQEKIKEAINSDAASNISGNANTATNPGENGNDAASGTTQANTDAKTGSSTTTAGASTNDKSTPGEKSVNGNGTTKTSSNNSTSQANKDASLDNPSSSAELITPFTSLVGAMSYLAYNFL